MLQIYLHATYHLKAYDVYNILNSKLAMRLAAVLTLLTGLDVVKRGCPLLMLYIEDHNDYHPLEHHFLYGKITPMLRSRWVGEGDSHINVPEVIVGNFEKKP